MNYFTGAFPSTNPKSPRIVSNSSKLLPSLSFPSHFLCRENHLTRIHSFSLESKCSFSICSGSIPLIFFIQLNKSYIYLFKIRFVSYVPIVTFFFFFSFLLFDIFCVFTFWSLIFGWFRRIEKGMKRKEVGFVLVWFRNTNEVAEESRKEREVNWES